MMAQELLFGNRLFKWPDLLGIGVLGGSETRGGDGDERRRALATLASWAEAQPLHEVKPGRLEWADAHRIDYVAGVARSGGRGLAVDSSSQRMLMTHQREPSLKSWMLLTPLAKGFSPGAVRDA